MRKDSRGLEISCASGQALEHYLRGQHQALSLDSTGIPEFRQAVELDPDFALAHAALARQLQIHGFSSEASSGFENALNLANQVSGTENSAVKFAAAAANGEAHAIAMGLNHVEEHPNDVFVLAHLLGPFGLLAFSGDSLWREKNVSLIDTVKPAYSSDDWWFNTSVAFLYAEVENLSKADAFAQRAWNLDQNGNTAHTMAHVHYEACALEEGGQFLDEWLTTHGLTSDMRHHLLWHQILLQLEKEEPIDLLSVYGAELDATVCDPMPLTTLCDNASLLWRCVLLEVPVPKPLANDVLEFGQKYFSTPGFVFAEFHQTMVAAIAGSPFELAEPLWLSSIGEAFRAFVSRDYQRSIALLEKSRQDTVLLGGSNPQRCIVEDTLLEACVRAGKKERGLQLMNQRGRSTPAESSWRSRLS
ncbi:MAG: hypothetical protein AAF438_12705 [Pseudomonadota bacterium]